MPTLTGQQIRAIAHHVMLAAGALEENAEIVAEHLADANLSGHDSHGLLRVPDYVRVIKEGRLDPRARPIVAFQDKALARVDGNGVFGQVGARFATDTAIRLAREYGIGLVTMCNIGHSGRLGTYPEMAAKEGMAAIMLGGNQLDASGGVAPFGGRKGRLGTNPLSMAFPYSQGRVILLDFATSATAVGKLRIYNARGRQLPGDWLLDNEGHPSSNPQDYFDGGSILPLGGLTMGHKGYALSFFVLLLGRMLGQSDPMTFEGTGRSVGDSTIIVIDIGKLRPRSETNSDVDWLINYLTDTPLLEGVDGIMYPGEIEARTRKEREARGVEVEETTWARVLNVIKGFGLEDCLGPLPHSEPTT